MLLKEQITEDMKAYMKNKDTYALEAIRMLRAEIKNAEIELQKELADGDIIKVIQSTIKKNKEAAEIYDKAGRTDLRDKELRYTEVLSKYMPKQLEKSEVEAIVREVVKELGDIDPKTGFGAVMKAAVAKIGSSADGKMINSVVREVLG